MTRQEIKNKIESLEFWLTHNRQHADYSKNEKQKKALEILLMTTK
jgi:hypothetical protein